MWNWCKQTWTCLYADMHCVSCMLFWMLTNFGPCMVSWTQRTLIWYTNSLSIVQALFLFMHFMLIIYCLRTLTHCDLQFSSTTEGAHYDAIAGQLNIPTDKLKSLSLNLSLSLSLLLCFLEENVLTSSSLVVDREVLQVLVDNGLVYTTINDDYYKSTVNAWYLICCVYCHAAV
jgi:hypothetical protein